MYLLRAGFRPPCRCTDVSCPHDGAVQVAHLEFLQTKRGTKLLTSGWWGAARKINYTGMSLCCGAMMAHRTA
jgi:hypothetical protein